MKYLLTGLALIASCAFLAAGEFSVVLEDTSGALAVSATFPPIEGYIESIVLDVAGSTTQVLSVVTSDETILTATATADGVYRPRIIGVTTGNSTLGANGIGDKIYIASEVLTVTVTPSSVPTNDVTVTIRYK
jgi:hypothetical protein